MKAVIFKEPKVVQIEERPVPQIGEPGDVICKVIDSALCGRLVNPPLLYLFRDVYTLQRATCLSWSSTKPDRIHYGP